MKRIVLGVSVFLILVQNGFATSKIEYNNYIQQYKHIDTLVNVLKCERIMEYYGTTGDVNKCLNAINGILNGKDLGPLNKSRNKYLSESYLNAGAIYQMQNDRLNAYKYYMESAKLGTKSGIKAQENMNILCKESPWACK